MENELQIEVLTDTIGGWGFTFESLRGQMKGFKGNKIRVPLNTYGGDAFAALAIHNTLLGAKAEVEINIVAYAASAGTMIACSGDMVTMADNGFFMLHNPSGGRYGEAEELDTVAKLLRDLTNSMVEMYYARMQKGCKAKGKPESLTKDQIRAMMAKTTWLPAADALEYGFVDSLTKGAKFTASADVDFFENVPEALKAQTAIPTPIVASQIPSSTMNEDLKLIAQDLGLSPTASVLDVRNAMFEQRKKTNEAADTIKTLQARVDAFEAKAKEAETVEADALIEAAVADEKITIEQKPVWKENFQANHDSTKKLLAMMTGKVVKLSEVPQTRANGAGSAAPNADSKMTYQGKTYSQLYEANGEALRQLRETDLATYNALGRSEYGKAWVDEKKD